MAEELTIEQLVGQGLEESVAEDMVRRVNQIIVSFRASECWQKISKEVLTPDHPFGVHKFLHTKVFNEWESTQVPAPAWIPSEDFIKTTNIAKLLKDLNLNSYEELHLWSVENRVDLWDMMIRRLKIQFKQKFTRIMDLSLGVESPRWLLNAKLNIVDSCFNSPDDSVAIVYQQEGGGLSIMTYGELNSLANRVANALMDGGFNQGDAIAIDMPMTAESVAIYLGIIKAGCIAVSIADSFAPDEIEKRLHLGNAKMIFTQDLIMRSGKKLSLYSKVIKAGAPKTIVLTGLSNAGACVSIQLRDGDLTWAEFLSDNDQFDSVACDPSDHTNILFSSGTTGDPKAIPWMHTTPIKCAADGYIHQNIQPEDVIAWPTSLGWMMGPWLIYASLINQATIALYYGAPTGKEFCQFVQDAGVTMLGVVPGLVAVWRNTGCIKGLNWNSIKVFSLTGECSNSEDMLYLMSMAGYKPVIEYCGGTEIGGSYITGTVVQPAAPATFSTPAIGLDLVILDENGQETDNGELFLIPPSIGLSTELLNKDHHEVYFEGTPPTPPRKKNFLYDEEGTRHVIPLRRHSDQVESLGHGYFRIHGRVDDTMNISGIKVSSAEIERTLNLINGINETAAVAVSVPGGGLNQLVIYAVLLPGVTLDKEELKANFKFAIKQHLNPQFKIHDVIVVDSLPRTASNKVMRRILRNRYKDSVLGKR